jgi:hypothetical protein
MSIYCRTFVLIMFNQGGVFKDTTHNTKKICV